MVTRNRLYIHTCTWVVTCVRLCCTYMYVGGVHSTLCCTYMYVGGDTKQA